jgi:hypothetical protein
MVSALFWFREIVRDSNPQARSRRRFAALFGPATTAVHRLFLSMPTLTLGRSKPISTS